MVTVVGPIVLSATSILLCPQGWAKMWCWCGSRAWSRRSKVRAPALCLGGQMLHTVAGPEAAGLHATHSLQLAACSAACTPSLQPAWLPCAGTKVVAVAAGMEHSLALTESGEVYSWGHAEHGRLGHGRAGATPRLFGTSIEFKPRLVRAFEALRIAQVHWLCTCAPHSAWHVLGAPRCNRCSPAALRPFCR